MNPDNVPVSWYSMKNLLRKIERRLSSLEAKNGITVPYSRTNEDLTEFDANHPPTDNPHIAFPLSHTYITLDGKDYPVTNYWHKWIELGEPVILEGKIKTREEIERELNGVYQSLERSEMEKRQLTYGGKPEMYDSSIQYFTGWRDALRYVLGIKIT